MESGISAIIASDQAVIGYAKSQGVDVHISTQLNVTNIEEVKFFSKYADVIVLARELTLKQVKFITEEITGESIPVTLIEDDVGIDRQISSGDGIAGLKERIKA